MIRIPKPTWSIWLITFSMPRAETLHFHFVLVPFLLCSVYYFSMPASNQLLELRNCDAMAFK